MEDFWQNIKDTIILLIKVMVIIFLVDIVLKIQEMDFRMPFVSYLTDWIFYWLAEYHLL